MSKQGKTWTTIVVIIVLIIIVWIIWGGNKATAPASIQTGSEQALQTVPAGPEPVLSTSATDSSDLAIQTDLDSVDAQLNALSSDTADLDQGINDSSAITTL